MTQKRAAIKPKTCRVCGDEFYPWASTLQIVCSVKCSVEHAKAQEAKKRKAERIRMKREFRANDRPHQLKLTQAVVNRWVVHVRDVGLPCFTCGLLFTAQKIGGVIDCGHYLTVGAHPELRFETRQLARQCISCNRHNGGRPREFRAALIQREGIEFVEWLEGPHDDMPKMTCPDLIDLRAHYSRLIRETA